MRCHHYAVQEVLSFSTIASQRSPPKYATSSTSLDERKAAGYSQTYCLFVCESAVDEVGENSGCSLNRCAASPVLKIPRIAWMELFYVGCQSLLALLWVIVNL